MLKIVFIFSLSLSLSLSHLFVCLFVLFCFVFGQVALTMETQKCSLKLVPTLLVLLASK